MNKYRELQKKVYEIIYPEGVSLNFLKEKELSLQDVLRAIEMKEIFYKLDKYGLDIVGEVDEIIRHDTFFKTISIKIEMDKPISEQSPEVHEKLLELIHI